MTDHLYRVLSNIHRPVIWQDHRQARWCSVQTIVSSLRCQYWRCQKLKSTSLKIVQSWICRAEFRTSDYTSLPSQKPSNQNNSFLLDYHADGTQPDMMCHSKLSCWRMRLAHGGHHNGAGADHAATVAQNTASDWLLLKWSHLLHLCSWKQMEQKA